MHSAEQNRRTDSKINTTLRTVGSAQTDVGSKVIQSWRYKSEDQKMFKNLSGKEEKHMSLNGRSLSTIVGYLREKKSYTLSSLLRLQQKSTER